MANTQSVLVDLLRTALRDASDATWPETEKQSLVDRAVDACPLRPLLRTDVMFPISDGDHSYGIDPTVASISRIDLTLDGAPAGSIPSGLWEVTGDLSTGNAEVTIDPSTVTRLSGRTAQVIGHGRYDTASHPVPDDFVPFVIAHARAEAWSRMVSDRARFRNWEVSEQTLNVSVNEVVLMLNDAQREREREQSRIFRFRKPMPARRA